jgi:hypothetical protein
MPGNTSYSFYCYTLDYFFTPRIASFAALATRNLTTVLAGILIFCCVLGLKPVRAFLRPLSYLPRATAVVDVFADRFLEVPGGRVSGLLLRIL